MLFYPGTSYTVTHLRCYEIANLVDVASATDWDQCIAPGCPFPNGWAADRKVRISWSDNGAGGQFGTLDHNGNFVPLDPILHAQQITHYRASPNNPGIVHITLEVNDAGLYYNDEPSVVNDSDNGNVTVWEFWITNHCPENWRPQLWDTLSFTAKIRPTVDHLGNSLAGVIKFHLEASQEPSFCLNACCEGYEICSIQDMCPLFPYCAYDVGVLWGLPECLWHQLLLQSNELWKTMTIWDSDLKFLPSQEGFDVNDPACTEAVTKVLVTDATVQVVCLDYGAFGFLTVTSDHPILGEIGARLPFGVYDDFLAEVFFLYDPDVGIPYDYTVEGIADCWQERYEWQYTSDALGDADDTPQGEGIDGDGLSTYEEYRGLKVRGTWQDFDPKVKDMFVMNFGAGYYDPIRDRWVEPEIPNEAITSQDGFPGQGMPLLWLLNANEGALRWVRHPLAGDIPGKIVNFLYGYAHFRDVYAAVVVPSRDDRPEFAWTLGPIWDGYRWVQINDRWILVCDQPLAPVIEVRVPAVEADVNDWNRLGYNYDFLHALACVIAHELGHTVLWDVDHNLAVQNGQDPMSILTNGDSGHHVYQQHRMRCFMWPYFPPGLVPDLDGDGNFESLPFPNLPTDFCDSDPGCQFLWHLNPKKR